jgi:hypothetical protein
MEFILVLFVIVLLVSLSVRKVFLEEMLFFFIKKNLNKKKTTHSLARSEKRMVKTEAGKKFVLTGRKEVSSDVDGNTKADAKAEAKTNKDDEKMANKRDRKGVVRSITAGGTLARALMASFHLFICCFEMYYNCD